MDENCNIRVADFGLTKDIYTNEYYRGQKYAALPVKWMSPESILDNYFNEMTDVVCVYRHIVISNIIVFTGFSLLTGP